MTYAARMAREDAITDALRATNDAIGDEVPTPQALRIIEAIKRLRASQPVRVARLERVDYLERVQQAARAAWMKAHGNGVTGPEHDASAGIDTPIGRLTMTIWRRQWNGKRGVRIAWAGEYYLNGEPITIAEIKEAGLAQRPTTRNRQRAAPSKGRAA